MTATAPAASDGAFSLSIPAQLGDQLEVTAADAAGNVSGPLSLRAGPTPTTPYRCRSRPTNHFLTLTSGEGAFTLPFTGGNERFTLIVQALNHGSGTFPLTVAGNTTAEVRGLAPSALSEDAGGAGDPDPHLRRR